MIDITNAILYHYHHHYPRFDSISNLLFTLRPLFCMHVCVVHDFMLLWNSVYVCFVTVLLWQRNKAVLKNWQVQRCNSFDLLQPVSIGLSEMYRLHLLGSIYVAYVRCHFTEANVFLHPASGTHHWEISVLFTLTIVYYSLRLQQWCPTWIQSL